MQGKRMERVTGIEPVTEAWEAFVIPFHHTRGDAPEVAIPSGAVKHPVGQAPPPAVFMSSLSFRMKVIIRFTR
jgi:hypothetical protein